MKFEASAPIEVPKIVSDEQTQSFVENGYLVVPDLLSLDEIEELRRDTVTIAKGGHPCDNLEPLPDDISDAEAISRILCIHQPHFVSPIIEKYVKHPENLRYLESNSRCTSPLLGWQRQVHAVDALCEAPKFSRAGVASGRNLHPDAGSFLNWCLDRDG